MELTASGMDVAAARKVSPEMMVGICRRDLLVKALQDSQQHGQGCGPDDGCNLGPRGFASYAIHTNASTAAEQRTISVHHTSRKENPAIHTSDNAKVTRNNLDPLEGHGLRAIF